MSYCTSGPPIVLSVRLHWTLMIGGSKPSGSR